MTDPTIETRRKTYGDAAAVISEQLGVSRLAAIASAEAVDRATALGCRYDRITLEQENGEWIWLGHYIDPGREPEGVEVEDKLTIATLELHEAIERGEPEALALARAGKRLQQTREYQRARDEFGKQLAIAAAPALRALKKILRRGAGEISSR